MATRKQHYIPRMILKHFTYFQIPMKQPLIYQYDKNKNIERLVSAKDICRKDNLYELKDSLGNILEAERNLIEKNFSTLESDWDKIIHKIINKLSLSDKERDLMCILIVLQTLRTPEMIELVSQWLYESSNKLGKTLNKYTADRYAKLATFVWGEVKPDTHFILDIILERMLFDKELIIFQSDTPFILNGNRPVLCLNVYCGLVQWYLPITPNFCLSLTDKSLPLYSKISNEITNWFNLQNFSNDGRYVYSSESILEKHYNLNYFTNIQN